MMARIIDMDALPVDFPTHRHDPVFWERLGRTVATYGFLEEILGKAIFSFTATRRYEEAEVNDAFARWRLTLERALTNPLGSLIKQYEEAVRDHEEATVEGLDELLGHLREAARLRNVLCHGSWAAPDENGASRPRFVDQKCVEFNPAIDIAFLVQVQRHVAELSCAVISSVIQMGWEFPGKANPSGRIRGIVRCL